MTERTPSRIAAIALASSLALAALAFASASWTGAAVMMALAVQSIVAACHQAFLLKTLRASERREKASELEFRSFVVAVLLYALGAGVALSEGTASLSETRAVVSPLIDILALALSVGIQGAALVLTLAFLHDNETTASPPKEPPLAALLIEHAGSIASLLIASLGVAFLALLEVTVADGTAAVTVGLVMALIATAMSLEVRKALRRRNLIVPPETAAPPSPTLATVTEVQALPDPMHLSEASGAVPLAQTSRRDKKRHKRHR